MINTMDKTTSVIRIVIAGLLSFLATLSTAQAILFLLWLVGNPSPQYKLLTGLISGLVGLFVGGLITTRVMDSEDVWISAFNGLLVGGASSYFLLGLDPMVLGITVLAFVVAGLGGFVGLRRKSSQTQSSP